MYSWFRVMTSTSSGMRINFIQLSTSKLQERRKERRKKRREEKEKDSRNREKKNAGGEEEKKAKDREEKKVGGGKRENRSENSGLWRLQAAVEAMEDAGDVEVEDASIEGEGHQNQKLPLAAVQDHF